MTELPLGWALTDFDAVTTPVEKNDPSNEPDKDIWYVDISSIDNQTNRIAEPQRLRLKSAPSRARQIIKEGDVLFSLVRPYLRKIAPVTAKYDGELASTGFAVLRPANGVLPEYLLARALFNEFVTALSGEQYGVSYPAVKEEQVKAQPFPLPPTNEQRRIVEKFETLFADLDAGVESLTRARARLALYRQSVLKAAFEGRLTADWRAQNPDKLEDPDTLLARIQDERAARYKQALDDWQVALAKWRADGEEGRKPAKPKRPTDPKVPTFEQLSRLSELPLGWAYVQADGVCDVVRGGSPRPAGDPRYYGGSIPFLKVADLTRVPGKHVSTWEYSITEAGLSKTRWVEPDTLLISNSGATLGVPKITKIGATFNDGIAAFLGLSHAENEYLYWYWSSQTRPLRLVNQGAAQPNLNTEILGSWPVPVCSSAEQSEVVKRLESKLSNIDALEAQIDGGLARAKALRQSILKRAFAGQLVAQDPNDEPAHVLLERIKAEKAAAPKAKRRRKANA